MSQETPLVPEAQVGSQPPARAEAMQIQPPLYAPYQGLGGWLVLVQIGFYLTIIIMVVSFIRDFLPVFKPEVWNQLTSPESPNYIPMYKTLVFTELGINIVDFLYVFVVLYFFYAKKRLLPLLMIIYYLTGPAVLLIDEVLVKFVPVIDVLNEGLKSSDLIRSFIPCLIWIPYFLVSKRVKSTFVR